jgi:hypothetical protein
MASILQPTLAAQWPGRLVPAGAAEHARPAWSPRARGGAASAGSLTIESG